MPGLRCRAVVVPSSLRTRNHDAATGAGARHDLVGRTVLVECVPPRRDALRDSGDETRLEGRLSRRHGWQPWRGALPLKVGYGSARNSLADTRARRPYDGCAAVARLQVICHGVRSRISTRASACIHSYIGLSLPVSARYRASRRQLASEEGVHRHLTRPHIRSRPGLAGR